MCGRFALNNAIKEAAKRLQVKEALSLPPDYNVAPGKTIPVILTSRKSKEREMHLMCWGLIPSWAKDPKIGFRHINARAETVHTSRVFAPAFEQRRCIIPADGFYEWKKPEKQPYYFSPAHGGYFAFAGLWDRWRNAEGEIVLSCAIITTGANERVRDVHHRMPAILSDNEAGAWLDTAEGDEELHALLKPLAASQMECRPVSRAVNHAAGHGEQLIAPVTLNSA